MKHIHHGKLTRQSEIYITPTPGKGDKGSGVCHTTLVLTRGGYKKITKITSQDQLWDGLTWVTSDGVVAKGQKPAVLLDHVRVSQDQIVVAANMCMVSASTLATVPRVLDRALDYGSKLANVTRMYRRRILTCKSKIKTEIYQIVNAGPRDRFTIKTDSGHLIIYNCGHTSGGVG